MISSGGSKPVSETTAAVPSAPAPHPPKTIAENIAANINIPTLFSMLIPPPASSIQKRVQDNTKDAHPAYLQTRFELRSTAHRQSCSRFPAPFQLAVRQIPTGGHTVQLPIQTSHSLLPTKNPHRNNGPGCRLNIHGQNQKKYSFRKSYLHFGKIEGWRLFRPRQPKLNFRKRFQSPEIFHKCRCKF